MELKPYQSQVIKDLESYLDYLNKYRSADKAYNQYWEDKIGKYNPLENKGMKPYKNNIPNAVHVAIKVPTAGGKTFIAINALHSLNKYFNQGNPKAVVWLVPWTNLLQQTYNHFSNPSHPYREKLNSLFGNKVGVYLKDQLLQGASFSPSSVTEQLNIFIFNFSSLRIDKAKQEDRKIYQENGALISFRTSIVENDLVLENTDETALINVIRSLNPIVIVDESHNAESDLSVEMLNNLNPSLVLDLTATPKENSNIISFVSALKLKQENMVKLPVIVYNHHKKEEVINNALHLRQQLEIMAKAEEKETGKYIRPIILFQAQSNIKGKDNTTFQKIKEQLIKLKIPEEQIKIKVSGIDELKGVNLMDKKCPVRYIITINALKEGWDCPNAYILASLADKSSAVDIEQILGRVLRQPYVVKHQDNKLNVSYVMTASSKFKETLDNIVNGLQNAGFSKNDYFAEDEYESVPEADVIEQELFGNTTNNESETRSDEEFELESINFDPNSVSSLEDLNANTILSSITAKAELESQKMEESIHDMDIDENTNLMMEIMKKVPEHYSIEEKYKEIASRIMLPQFYLKVDKEEISESILFEELASYEIPLNKNNLLKGFNLLECDTKIDFQSISAEIYKVDFDADKNTATANKMTEKLKNFFIESILAKPHDRQINEVANFIVKRLGDMTPISEQNLKKYVSRVFEALSNEQITEVIHNEFIYTQKIKEKINFLTTEYSKKRFTDLLNTNEIVLNHGFQFSEKITPINTSIPISKSLYEKEDKLNGFEQDMIMSISALDNVVFWHKNLNRGKGFFINGYSNNHYPDFIILTEKGNLLVIETKGDDRDNDDSRDKTKLGKIWESKAGEKFKYFMVFQTKIVPDCYNASGIIDVIKRL